VDEVLESPPDLVSGVVAWAGETKRSCCVLLAVAIVPKVQQVPIFVDGEEFAFISKWWTTVNQHRAVAAVKNVPHAHACLPNPARRVSGQRKLSKCLRCYRCCGPSFRVP
jgi:hypothetical protein